MSTVHKLNVSYLLYSLYEDLLNSYVCDYYVEDHWKKLPKAWQNCLSHMSMDEVAHLLDLSSPPKSTIFPLSLLSLRCLITHNSLLRTQITNVSSASFKNDKIKNLFWKNVKLKKRHEISILADLCYRTALKTNCFIIVDIGSGVGHLSRLFAYKYGFKVCTFEANKVLTDSAQKLDKAFEQALAKYKIESKQVFTPVHINKRITNDMNIEIFKNEIKNALNEKNDFKFGIVGLHPCGDLSPTLLRLFEECSGAVFINIASCCYMKMTLNPSPIRGFPISNHCQINNFNLSYLSCEISCHAIENYVNKLKNKDYLQLKIHAYRAAVEKLLTSLDPMLKHSCITSVKYTDGLTFSEYCSKVIKKYQYLVSDDTIVSYEQLINNTWHDVVVFYSLRLLFAPLIESVILYDRMLFLEEKSMICDIIPAFDCIISPRNFVITSRKK